MKDLFLQECEKCGHRFSVRYYTTGDIEYVGIPCTCEAPYHPVDGEPSIGEWLEATRKAAG